MAGAEWRGTMQQAPGKGFKAIRAMDGRLSIGLFAPG
jgi:hypothetical protein